MVRKFRIRYTMNRPATCLCDLRRFNTPGSTVVGIAIWGNFVNIQGLPYGVAAAQFGFQPSQRFTCMTMSINLRQVRLLRTQGTCIVRAIGTLAGAVTHVVGESISHMAQAIGRWAVWPCRRGG